MVKRCWLALFLAFLVTQKQQVQAGIKSVKVAVTQKRVADWPALQYNTSPSPPSVYRGGLCVEGFAKEDCLGLTSLYWFPMQ